MHSSTGVIQPEQADLPGLATISAQAAMVIRLPVTGTPRTIFAKNPHARFAPASLTKLLTVMTALDLASRFGNPSDIVLEMREGDEAKGTGNNISAGDRLSFQDAVANMMLPSSNVTANVVARTFGQLLLDYEGRRANPVRRFVRAMNATAAGLEMMDSVFRNPHGLKDAAQVTTAADMAKLLIAASQCQAITHVWGRTAYDVRITGRNARIEHITSSVTMIGEHNVCGGKTGTLRAITYNLAILSQTAAGDKYASALLCAPSDSARYADMRLLLNALAVA